MRVVQEKKINEEYHKVQMLTTVAMPTPYISASLSHTAYINNVVSLVRLLTERTAWKNKAGNVSTVMQKIMVKQILTSKLKSIIIIPKNVVCSSYIVNKFKIKRIGNPHLIWCIEQKYAIPIHTIKSTRPNLIFSINFRLKFKIFALCKSNIPAFNYNSRGMLTWLWKWKYCLKQNIYICKYIPYMKL